MKNIRIFVMYCLVLLLVSNSVFAQTSVESVDMADKFRADGKIYVVVVVMLIVLGGLWAYIWALDRKIAKIEKELSDIIKS